ncbi:MAG: hypothetical protein ABI361_03425 [Nitrososphaera sp.]
MTEPNVKKSCQVCRASAVKLAELNGMALCPECFLKMISKMVGES